MSKLRVFMAVLTMIIWSILMVACIIMIFKGIEFYKPVILLIIGSLLIMFISTTVNNQLFGQSDQPLMKDLNKNNNQEKINL